MNSHSKINLGSDPNVPVCLRTHVECYDHCTPLHVDLMLAIINISLDIMNTANSYSLSYYFPGLMCFSFLKKLKPPIQVFHIFIYTVGLFNGN